MAQYSVIAGRIECSRAAIDKLIDLLQLMPAGLLDGLRSFVSLSPKLLLMIIRHDVMRCYEIVLLCLWYLDNVTCLSFVSLLWFTYGDTGIHSDHHLNELLMSQIARTGLFLFVSFFSRATLDGFS